MPDKVMCADCGFLALRDLDTRELVEAEKKTRKTGDRGAPFDVSNYLHGTSPSRETERRFEFEPICFAAAYDLEGEFNCAAHGDSSMIDAFQKVIIDSRQCESFVKWQQGYSPKEHREMVLERERLEWQARQESEMREFQAKQAELNRTYNDRNIKLLMWMVVVTLLAPIISAVISVKIVNSEYPTETPAKVQQNEPKPSNAKRPIIWQTSN